MSNLQYSSQQKNIASSTEQPSDPPEISSVIQNMDPIVFFEWYCKACHSLGRLFKGQRQHKETCINGSILGMIADAESWMSHDFIFHFINIVLGIDTRKIRFVPSGELLQCSRCMQYYPRTTFVHHITHCDSSSHKPQQPAEEFLTDATLEEKADHRSDLTLSGLLKYVAISVTYVLHNSILFHNSFT